MRSRGAWVVTVIILVTILFSGIVTKFWLSGQKKKFMTKRVQLIEKIEGKMVLSSELKADVSEFNRLVSTHPYLRYLDIPMIPHKSTP